MIFMWGGGGGADKISSKHSSVTRYIFTMTRACTIYFFSLFFFGSIYTLNKERMSNF